MLWGIVSWHTAHPLVVIKYYLNATAYLGIQPNHVPQFMITLEKELQKYCHESKF